MFINPNIFTQHSTLLDKEIIVNMKDVYDETEINEPENTPAHTPT